MHQRQQDHCLCWPLQRQHSVVRMIPDNDFIPPCRAAVEGSTHCYLFKTGTRAAFPGGSWRFHITSTAVVVAQGHSFALYLLPSRQWIDVTGHLETCFQKESVVSGVASKLFCPLKCLLPQAISVHLYIVFFISISIIDPVSWVRS